MPALLRARLEQLMTHDQELQKLAKEHSEYEAQLRQLAKSPYLNLEDLQREVTLKKLKLRVKDAIERHLAELIGQDTPASDPAN